MSVKIRKILENIAGERAPGPAPTFSVFHVIRALELIAEKPIGRGKLAEKLGIGPGAIRTIVNRLKSTGLISTSKSGCSLTSKGLKLYKEIRKIFGGKSKIDDGKLIQAKYNFAILAKKCGHKVKSGMEQRDAAIKVGAKGAAVIVVKDGRFIIPSASEDASKDYPTLVKNLVELFKPEENDVIIIGGADSQEMAEYGAMAAAWTLISECQGG
ncbi:DUF4443 domain-containing protein [Candidatus Bathyarchaeota archaeon]|nr:DUF4443 domain-containing protein [Candidatus Bathyarchaeota archaeon]